MDKRTLVGLLVFLILLIALPLILLEVKTQQELRQRASYNVWNGGDDTCKLVHVSFESETPTCPSSGTKTDSYVTKVRLHSIDGGSHKVYPLFESFWCHDTGELGDGVNPESCVKRRLVNNNNGQPITVSGGNDQFVTSVEQKASSYGNWSACGFYQTDFSFTVDGTTCYFGYPAIDTNPNHPVLAAGYCKTNQTCVPPTNTPVPPTKTPTPTTPLATHTPTSTPGITLTDTPTGTPSATDTPTGEVSTTPTDTPPPGSTPTPTPTSPPGSTPTPTSPVVSTPGPTLPPTGPGDTIFGLGIVGIALALVGVIFVLAF